ncbi:hypothetical protein DASC09_011120 [Saccharomycopsis crataegensis]|uniref:Uncharacterized protein n=1 Tax=Saccharomycopsis crataegensis TaxID=43959 RepID=A0AAV5QGN4_9ASCO|nr:hypothetical protein DASC09_011120 [Saccharomycopsis crataegensis]
MYSLIITFVPLGFLTVERPYNEKQLVNMIFIAKPWGYKKQQIFPDSEVFKIESLNIDFKSILSSST